MTHLIAFGQARDNNRFPIDTFNHIKDRDKCVNVMRKWLLFMHFCIQDSFRIYGGINYIPG